MCPLLLLRKTIYLGAVAPVMLPSLLSDSNLARVSVLSFAGSTKAIELLPS